MSQEVSPEEYKRLTEAGKTNTGHRASYKKPAAAVAVLVVVLVIGFGSGIAYQKGRGTAAQTATADSSQFAQQNGMGGPGGMRQPGAFGEVTAVSEDSITIEGSAGGDAQTFKITNSTTISDNGTSATVGDIRTGDTGMVRSNSSAADTATSIILNPTMMGPGAGNRPGLSDPAGTTDSTNGTSST